MSPSIYVPLTRPTGIHATDSWMWGVVEQQSNSNGHASISDLKRAIRKAAGTIDPDEDGARAPLSGALSRVCRTPTAATSSERAVSVHT